MSALSEDPRRDQAKRASMKLLTQRHGQRLVKKGQELAGPCPFCSGGKDRFYITKDDIHWACRQCRPEGGDTIDYIMEIDHCSYPEALDILAGPAATPRPKPAPAPAAEKPKKTAEISHQFCNPYTGEKAYLKVRREYADGSKDFFFTGRKEPLLYGGERLQDLRDGDTIVIVEGEKKVDWLWERGIYAVSADTGDQSKWPADNVMLLFGLRIVIWPDSDAPGEKYAANFVDAMRGYGAFTVEPDIRVIRPFGPPNGRRAATVATGPEPTRSCTP
jgi:DNA primase